MRNKTVIFLCALFSLLQAVIPSAFAETPATPEANPGTQLMNSRGESMTLEFKLFDPGTETCVDYEKYGTFEGLGTEKYVYKTTNRKGLAAAVGTGVYPNTSVYKDPVYRMLVTKGKLRGSAWDYVNIDDQQIAFYKWATHADTPAVQQFYTAMTLEKLGQIPQAIKAYHAVIVHFPKQVGWTFWHTPLYMAKLSADRIEYLTRKHPEAGVKVEGLKVEVKNGFNFDTNDDQFIINPGKLVKASAADLKPKKQDVSGMKVIKTVGSGRSQLVQFENRHWQMRVDGKPYMMKGMCYAPSPVGKSPQEGTLDPNNDWMNIEKADLNKNGKEDGPYDAWVDKNKNNQQDPDEKAVGDFQLMKEMGVNTIRLYHHASSKDLLRRMHKEYGLNVIMGDMLGMYAAGSGADWYKGTDYTNPQHLENMRNSVKKMVEEYKDEPYVLMWMLGNESNYGEVGDPDPKSNKAGLGSNAKTQPEEHYKFVNEVAKMIKSIDPTRPVGFSNGEVVTIDVFSRNCPDVDVFGANVYRGAFGFGKSFWADVKQYTDRPTVFTEYGCPGYMTGKSSEIAEEKQLEYHQGNWEDILLNAAGSGEGNALGGFVFEWVDEWWKSGLPPKFSASEHETIGDFTAAFPDGTMHEEWLGLLSQGEGKHSPYLRQKRKVFDYYKKAWNEGV